MKSNRCRPLFLHLIGSMLLAAVCAGTAADWPQWRGPALNGTSPAHDLPVSWNLADGTNIAWVTDLPGVGQSTPIVVGDRIYLTLARGETHDLHGLSFDRATGRLLWSKHLGQGRRGPRDNEMAAVSPVSDGDKVWFLFGQGTLACLTRDGDVAWTRELEPEFNALSQKYGYSSSPLLHHGVLYIPVLRRLAILPPAESNGKPVDSFLLAVDGATGKTLWRTQRPTPAIEESLDSYNTPVLLEGPDDQRAIVLVGGDLVTAHDVTTGRELWRHDFVKAIGGERNTMWRIISGPVIADGLVVTSLPRGGTMIGVRPPGSPEQQPEEAWRWEDRAPDVCVPAFNDGLLYVLDGRKRYLSCLEADTGTVVWQRKVDSRRGFYASPTLADGKLYLIDLEGHTEVWKEGRQAKQLAAFSTAEERCIATPVAVDNALFLRTPTRLICIKKN